MMWDIGSSGDLGQIWPFLNSWERGKGEEVTKVKH